MKNILIAGDLHIDSPSLEECSLILNEEKEIIRKYKVDTYIDTGDTFNFLQPNSDELDLFSNFLKDINIPSIMLAANSHESTTTESSIINHFGILNSQVKVVKEFIDKEELFVGHFGLQEARLQKYGATRSIKEFEKFRWVVLGHFHSFEKVGKNCVQLGSSRWVTFAEAGDKNKVVMLIEGYNSENPKINFLALKTPYLMKDIVVDGSGKNIENRPLSASNLTHLLTILDKTNAKTKVRVNFSDYELWRTFLPYEEQYKQKFVIFKVKKDFILNEIIVAKKEKQPLKESLIKWMNANNVPEKIREILLGEIK